MSVKIEFDTDNDAFSDFDAEVKRILYKVCAQIGDGCEKGVVRDINGNTIGSWEADREGYNDRED